ncbi:membrane protein [Bacteroidia bacterium]|nr:membrane protein [Bacteroidia bacterium]
MLEEETFAIISKVPDSDEGADQLAVGAYSYLLNDMLRWDQFPKVLDMDCDYATGPDWSLSKIGAGNFQGEDAMDPVWTKCFTIIHRANNAIEKIGEMSPSAHKDNVVGEMQFLKSYGYFLLVRAYGAVPLHKQSVSIDPEFSKPRASIADVYGYIVEQLKEAQAVMYKNTDPNFKEGRASAGTAAALLAKVYATMASGAQEGEKVLVKGGTTHTGDGDSKKYIPPTPQEYTTAKVAGYDFDVQAYYDSARIKAKEVIDGIYGSYDLLPYDQLWTSAMRHKTEHIFMIQPVTGDDMYGAGIARYYTGTTDGSEMIIEGLFHGCSNAWYRLFDQANPQDLRVELGVMHRWINRDYHQSWNGGAFYPDDEQWTGPSRGIWASKALGYYIDELTNEQIAVARDKIFDDGRQYQNNKSSDCSAFLTKYYNAADRSQPKSDVPYPILRFADVLLIYAEAANETGEFANAINALNRVRERSRARLYTGAQEVETLRSAILEERAKELALESDRRWDLIRYGIYKEVMNAIETDENGIKKHREDKHLLYPIPVDALSANKNLTQNEGW